MWWFSDGKATGKAGRTENWDRVELTEHIAYANYKTIRQSTEIPIIETII